MSYRLFLDDVREPTDALMYMHTKLGKNNVIYLEDWDVVRSYDEFVKKVEEKGIPDFVSYDHDLAEEHYITADETEWEEYHIDDRRERTGLDCCKWLNEYCKKDILNMLFIA